ncbi:MAG: flagellar protein export ATPase FliI [Fimbriimonadaceae bacterium]|nr:flagellar protein export ATPase FliI [Fimbriimonadaceae bacterium]
MRTLNDLRMALVQIPRTEQLGQVAQVVGLVIESVGPHVRVGDLCYVEANDTHEGIPCEVVGFRDERVLLMPLGELHGIGPGCSVRSTGHCLRVPVGERLLGRVVNALGQPIDGGLQIPKGESYPSLAAPPNAMERAMIEAPMATGVRAIDSMLTMGIGQRMGIFAGSGVGKSTLLGMIARNGDADVNVIALVGERGREVREFMENDLGEEGMKRSVVVCATSDEPALLRIKAAYTATAIAESFRDQGLNVMLMMDSVTRFAMAQREVGLAVGEPPSTKGYTPSVFAILPRLMERAGCGARGAITAIYTVLVDGDDTNEPIADAARSILDGHIVLDRKLTSRGHYPPINVLQSLSRVMPMVVNNEHVRSSQKLRHLLAAYDDVEDLISVGAYKSGSNAESDEAVEKHARINAFLQQEKSCASLMDDTVRVMKEIALG